MKKSDEDHRLAKLVGKSIANRRIEKGLTQEEVAERLGVGYEAISRMERGVIMPTIAKIIQLAEVFDTPVDTLLMESSNRVTDQAIVLADTLQNLSPSNREFLLGMIKELAARMD